MIIEVPRRVKTQVVANTDAKGNQSEIVTIHHDTSITPVHCSTNKIKNIVNIY